MADSHPSITAAQASLIATAPLFYVATADPNLVGEPDGVGPINMSPKGGVPLHVLDPNRVAYLDYAGSGDETARHSIAGGPITIMVCSFEDANAGIVRLYGLARVTPLDGSPLADLLLERPAAEIKLPGRQIIEIESERTASSCGYDIPVMRFIRERTVADRGRRYKAAR